MRRDFGNRARKWTLFALLGISGTLPMAAGDADDHLLWSDRPVVLDEKQAANLRTADKIWSEEVFPLGNGRLGCTVFGDPSLDRIQFNEDSLWVGNEDHTGGYQPFGDLYIRLDGQDEYDGYRRELDIRRAVQTVRYRSGGVGYTREYFASHPDQVIAIRLTADKPGALSGVVWLDSMHRSKIAEAQGHPKEAMDAILTEAAGSTLTLKGETKDLFWWAPLIKKGLRGREYASDRIINLEYEAQVRVLQVGGSLSSEGDRVVFSKCDELVLLLAADTSYLNDRSKGWKGPHPHAAIDRQLHNAAGKGFDRLFADHIADYRSLYDRFSISLGKADPEREKLETEERVKTYQPGKDPGLETLMYRYARYLMISCSRPGHGGMPANLQGLWLHHLRPAWLCDYHTDINLQMNYWFVDQANLSECFVPLAEWLDSIREVRKEETEKVLGIKRGWLMRSENGIFGGSTYYFQKGDSAWICQNLWDHYAFTQDREYLRRMAYPVMKEICEFWFDHLKEMPDGTLVVPDGTSPEHGPKVGEDGKVTIVEGHRTHLDGVSYDQQLCWDLFTNTIEASSVLRVDEEFRAQLRAKKAKLLGPKNGKWGQLQEWMEDLDDPKSQHRHVSHMLAVYPGRQIHPTITPEFAQAAKVSMTARGNGHTGWSKVFRACVFARLLEPERAYELIADVLQTKTHGNLWTTHPPFQIDCNFGFAAGVNEMLVQSHMGVLHLLPALPKEWSSGSVRGMRVRGGLEIDMAWEGGRIETLRIYNRSNAGSAFKLRIGSQDREIHIQQGTSIEVAPGE